MAIQHIAFPADVSSSNFSLSPEDTLVFDFDVSAASFERSEDALVVTFENGSKVTVDSFFISEDDELPALQLADGTTVSTADFLRGMNPDMDLTTAAGPSSASAPSSGVNDYADGAGDLLGGVDRLGSLGTTHWQGNPAGLREVAGIDGLTPLAEGTAEVPTPPIVIPDYTTRAVVYNPDGGTGFVRFYVVDSLGRMLVTDPADLSGYSLLSEKGLVDVNLSSLIVNPDGSVLLPLSSQYWADIAAQGGAASAGNMDDYITVVDANGTMHTMQVVVNHDGNYKPQDAEDLRESNIVDLEEWHSSSSPVEGPTSKESGGGDDAMWFDEDMTATRGANNTIDAKAGDDSLVFGKSIVANEGNNTVKTGDGNDTIRIEGNADAKLVGFNTFETGGGNDKVTLIGDMQATGGGHNIFKLGDLDKKGDNELIVEGDNVSATSSNVNKSLNGVYLRTSDGDNMVTIEKASLQAGVKGMSGRTANNDFRLDTQNGNNEFTLNKGSLNSWANSSTYISLKADNGTNELSLKEGGISSLHGGHTDLYLQGLNGGLSEGNKLLIKGDIETSKVGYDYGRTSFYLNGENYNTLETGAIKTNDSKTGFSTSMQGGNGAENKMTVSGAITHTGDNGFSTNTPPNQNGNRISLKAAGEGTNVLSAKGLVATGPASDNSVYLEGGSSSTFEIGEQGIVAGGGGVLANNTARNFYSSSRSSVYLKSVENSLTIKGTGVQVSGDVSSYNATGDHITISSLVSMTGDKNIFEVNQGGMHTSGLAKGNGKIKEPLIKSPL